MGNFGHNLAIVTGESHYKRQYEMKNFVFCNPTKLIFGDGSIKKLQDELPKQATILLTYGGGSIKRNGIYDQVKEQLADYRIVEFPGIEPNPDCTTLDRAIALGRKENVSYILAVGGGSVIDGSKLIAAGINTTGYNAWEIVRTGYYVQPIPLGCVLTVPATGSEMNRGAVISNRETEEKFSFYSEYPRFSILDPSFTYTLSKHQVACGIADCFMHTLEQYLTYPGQSGIMDRMAEGVLLNILDLAPIRINEDQNYDVACEYMLTATIGLNGFLSMGVEQDWCTHRIGHEITALTGITHGASLMMLISSVLRTLKDFKMEKVLQLGDRVFGIRGLNKEEVYEQVVQRIEAFVHNLGLASSLTEGGVSRDIALEVARRFEERGQSLGEKQIATPDIIRQILLLASK